MCWEDHRLLMVHGSLNGEHCILCLELFLHHFIISFSYRYTVNTCIEEHNSNIHSSKTNMICDSKANQTETLNHLLLRVGRGVFTRRVGRIEGGISDSTGLGASITSFSSTIDSMVGGTVGGMLTLSTSSNLHTASLCSVNGQYLGWHHIRCGF